MGAQQNMYDQHGYGMPPNPYGGHNYGMMGGGHMHGGGFGMGSGGGRGGVVPFRAGDWKCGSEGCNYHNFAKNVSCLRCGASRNQASVVGDGSQHQHHMGGFPPQGQYGGPPHNMGMPSMNPGSYGGGMDGSAYGGANMGAPPGGFSGQSYGPPSTYALPSGVGAPSPYMQGGYSQMGSNGTNQGQQGGFDSRAEQAFNGGNASAAGGASSGYSNGGGYNNANGGGYGNDPSSDSLYFLNSGMNQLGLGDREDRRNGQATAKSPQ